MKRNPIQPAAYPETEIYEVDTGDWKFEEPVVDPDACVECGRCHVFCPTKSVSRDDDHYTIIREWCKGCGICISVCPTEAIDMRSVSERSVQHEFEIATGETDGHE